MVRTQVQLTEEQAALVKRLATERGVSMAEIIRQSLEAFARTQAATTEDERWRRALAAAGSVRGGPRDLAVNHDKHIAEAMEH
jgi:Arc/MetJ-type ribon-helix-helix transcriptional regulator